MYLELGDLGRQILGAHGAITELSQQLELALVNGLSFYGDVTAQRRRERATAEFLSLSLLDGDFSRLESLISTFNKRGQRTKARKLMESLQTARVFLEPYQESWKRLQELRHQIEEVGSGLFRDPITVAQLWGLWNWQEKMDRNEDTVSQRD